MLNLSWFILFGYSIGLTIGTNCTDEVTDYLIQHVNEISHEFCARHQNVTWNMVVYKDDKMYHTMGNQSRKLSIHFNSHGFNLDISMTLDYKYSPSNNLEVIRRIANNFKHVEIDDNWQTALRAADNNASEIDFDSCDTVKRVQLENLLSQKSELHLTEDKWRKLHELDDELYNASRYNRICVYGQNENDSNTCEVINYGGTLNLPITDFNETLYYWKSWSDSFAEKRNATIEYMNLFNEWRRLNGFADNGQWARSEIFENASNVAEQLWTTIKPFYQQFHAYIRRKFISAYGEDKIKNDGPIPAHLLDVSEENLKSFLPYPNTSLLDISSALQNMSLGGEGMTKLAEDFFVSLGFEPLNQDFWNNSYFSNDSNCSQTAIMFCSDYRLSVCPQQTLENFLKIHSRMAAVERFKYLSNESFLLNADTFQYSSVIDAALALSSLSITRLRRLGLIEDRNDTKDQEINFLYEMARETFVNHLPTTYVFELWKWGVYNETIPFEQMNTKWWEMRQKYEGVCPMTNRNDEQLDPLSMLSLSFYSAFPIRQYFYRILKFQLFKAFCDATNHTGPLYKCDITGSLETGNLIRKLYGVSVKLWHELVKVLTSSNTTEIDAGPILEYFQPLYEWFQEQNKNETVEWKSYNQTMCPEN